MSLPENSATRARANHLEMTTLLERLCASDFATRAAAARAVYAHGCDLARRATKTWFGDSELARCFAPIQAAGSDDFGLPEATVGIAVQPARFESLRTANGSPRLADVPADIDAQEFGLHLAPGLRLDVLTSRDHRGEGAIARFLARQGEGIQQVELAALDADRAAELLQSHLGLKTVYPKARLGADGAYVNFLLVEFATASRDNKKLLIELVENRAGLL
jgi:hypothetical protein